MLRVTHIHDLRQTLRQKPQLRENVINYASEMVARPEYQDWLDNDEIYGQPFSVPRDFNVQNSDVRFVFDNLGLIQNELLQIRINKVNEQILFTDGLWVPSEFRVFPFTDESERLCEYLRQENLLNWADLIVDPATGCGHHANVLRDAKFKIAADINSRAVAYCDLNRVINDNQNIFVALHNIEDGMPIPVPDSITGNVLFVINMPFALSPIQGALPLSADGGDTGAKMTFAALNAIKKFSISCNTNAKIRAVILNYSIGKLVENTWETKEKAIELFGKDKVKFQILEGETMWRINGKKEQPNPMPITSISEKANCKFYVNNAKREDVRIGYKKLEKKLSEQGWNVLGYGILDVDLS